MNEKRIEEIKERFWWNNGVFETRDEWEEALNLELESYGQEREREGREKAVDYIKENLGITTMKVEYKNNLEDLEEQARTPQD